VKAMRVFVYEAYVPAGGTYMAYHIGRMMCDLFGAEVICVGASPTKGMFSYPVLFPVIDREQFVRAVSRDDMLICNPSFSLELFGLRLECRKLSYVQGIRTFAVLDIFFDHYVFVSEVVKQFVGQHYSINGPVIPAFIHTDVFHPFTEAGRPKEWEQRRRTCLVLQRKISPLVYERLQRTYAAMYPGEPCPWELVPIVSQSELAGRFRDSRVFVSLDQMEGFGLPMLEAMACGCAVVGWDSLGCREYARSGQNALLSRYGDFEGLARQLNLLLSDDKVAKELGAQAEQEACEFSQERFEQAWAVELKAFLAGRG
jgi:hypothetical protein